jgi:branched-chain amino acid transport system substrate-binding protein
MMRRRISTALVLAMALASSACGTRVESSGTASSQLGGEGGTAATVAASSSGAGAAEEGAVASTAADSAAAVPGSSASGSATVSPGAGSKGATAATTPSAGGTGGSRTASGASSASGAAGEGSTKGSGKNVAPVPGAPGPGQEAPVAPGASAGPKSEIKIGEVGVFSGPIGTNMKPISDSVRIWVRWINDRGGINGHRVTLLTGDSAGDPARHRALVQQLVEKGVIAFVGQPGEVFSGQGSVKYLTEQRVPVIGSEGGGSWFYESPVYFPQIQHGRALVQALAVGTAKEGVARGKTKLAIWTCVEAQTCKEVDDIVPKIAPKHGVKVVNSSKISIGQPDFTAECLNTQNAGAEMIFMAADGSTISRGAASCARQGYRPTWVLIGATILAKQHAEDPNLSGGIAVDTQAPWFLDNSPARKEWRDALAKYAPDLSTTSSNMIGWVAGKLFEYGMRKAPEPFTREGLLAALWSIKGDPLPELTVPYIFNPEKPATPTTCYWNAAPKDGKWFSSDGGQRHCFDYDTSI